MENGRPSFKALEGAKFQRVAKSQQIPHSSHKKRLKRLFLCL